LSRPAFAAGATSAEWVAPFFNLSQTAHAFQRKFLDFQDEAGYLFLDIRLAFSRSSEDHGSLS
jgi:hypothetical protein